MKKLYNFRLDLNLVKAVDRLDGTRTSIVTKSLQNYLQQTDNETAQIYDRQIQDLMSQQIEDLKQDKEYLRKQNYYLSLPWYQRLLLPHHKK